MKHDYDIIVAGGGHAGIEAALASARLGNSTCLITLDSNALGRMSCNPAIGGLAKGHLVREIDAMGGEMGLAIDQTGIQFKMLNQSKGRAVWSPRAQADKIKYVQHMVKTAKNTENLSIITGDVISLIVDYHSVAGVILKDGSTVRSQKVIITGGTFLDGIIHIGDVKLPSGRFGELPSVGLAAQLESLGFSVGRLKTGTPPRITKRSINFDKMVVQSGDEHPLPFSWRTHNFSPKNIPCYLTHTNSISHEIILSALDRSPLFTGKISGVGPRYCPSIEDKVVRFSDKPSHQLFLEPEWEGSHQWYVNGFSSSLPLDIQYKSLHEVPGLEKAEFIRPAYAIEYAYFPSRQIHRSFETKYISGLYFAGQVNGTSGYEEAAAQGLMAGINASRSLLGKEPIIFNRHDAYIGVLADDLVTKETKEPYRMFTSLAEYRLLLRPDNADVRLLSFSREVGLLPPKYLDLFQRRQEEISTLEDIFHHTKVNPDNSFNMPLTETLSIDQLVKRHVITENNLPVISQSLFSKYSYDSVEQAYVLAMYGGYIARQNKQVEKTALLENKTIPPTLNYRDIPSLSNEGREKLISIAPETIGQASRIRGVSPADIQILLIYLK